ncbi:MAG: galactose-1-epimerase, partial [Verrucomicrobiota bacterium]
LDFTTPHAVGARIEDEHEQMSFAAGYDHNFVIDKAEGESGLAATVHHAPSGRTMKVETTAPGVQFYGGNFLDGVAGKGGAIYARRTALCLEPQHFPDSPNRPEFPSTLLKPGETYRHLIRYVF